MEHTHWNNHFNADADDDADAAAAADDADDDAAAADDDDAAVDDDDDHHHHHHHHHSVDLSVVPGCLWKTWLDLGVGPYFQTYL